MLELRWKEMFRSEEPAGEENALIGGWVGIEKSAMIGN